MRINSRLQQIERRVKPHGKPFLILQLMDGQYSHEGQPLTEADVQAMGERYQLVVIQYADELPPLKAARTIQMTWGDR